MTLKRCIGTAAPLLLALAIAATGLLQGAEHWSAALSLSWVVLCIGRQALGPPGTSRLWPTALVAILVLNVRGIVLGEGPRPVSHMDYVLLIAAVLAGSALSRRHWRNTLSTVCLTIASCGLWQAPTVWRHLTADEMGYRLGVLLINQTALLAGLGCVGGWAALQLWRTPQDPVSPGTGAEPTRSSTRRLIQLTLALASGGCAVMVLATHSRAGIGLIPVSVLIAWGIQEGTRHRSELWNQLRRNSLAIGLALALLVGTPLVWMASPQGPALRGHLEALYGSENRISDQGRVDLWRCYFGLPFSGSNRFIYGVGFGRARELCPIRLPGIPKPLSHAHNLPLQIWADAGSLGLAMLLIAGLLLCRRVMGQQMAPQAMALSAPMIYGLLFNMLELGMLKVPLLIVLFGTALSGGLINVSAVADSSQSAAGSATSKAAVS